MGLVRLTLLAVLVVCCASSVLANEITYNYWNIGLSLSDRDSDYLKQDNNLYGKLNMSNNLFQFWQDDRELGVHFWIDVTQSRNISDNSAYSLTLVQSAIGFGAHYSTEFFSTYFRLGKGGSSVRFKSKSTTVPVPVVTVGSGDIFVPPVSIFRSEQSQTTYTNREDGTVGKIGIRYRISDKYETGAAVLLSDIDSFGTEFSAYIQRDFEGSPLRRTTSFGIGNGYLSMRADIAASDVTGSAGLSLVYSF